MLSHLLGLIKIMAKFQVITNQFSSDDMMNIPIKCHKLRKSSGKLVYQISQSTDNQLILKIDDISATKRQIIQYGQNGLLVKSYNLNSLLDGLVAGQTFGSAAKLLSTLPDQNDASFVAAVLLDLKIIRIA